MVKVKKTKAWKVLALLLTSVLVLQTCMLGLSAPVYAAENDDEDLEIEGIVDIFKAEYTKDGQVIIKSNDGDKVIAPGAENVGDFKIVNKSGKALTYRFTASLEFKSESGTTYIQDLPMQYKMVKDGNYILGDTDTWVDSEHFNVDRDDFFIKKGAASFYKVIWQWPFEISPEQNIKDTEFGNSFNGEATDTVTLNFTAQGSEVPEPDPATITGKTISTVTFVPEANQEYCITNAETSNEEWVRPTEEQLKDGRMSFEGLESFTEYTLHNRYFDPSVSHPAEQNITTRVVDAKEIAEAFSYYDGSSTTDGEDLQEVADNSNSHVFVDHDGNYAVNLLNNLNKTVNIPGNWEYTTLFMKSHNISGENGTSGTNGRDGSMGMHIAKADKESQLGTHLLINGPGNILGGDGGKGSNNGGNGATGIKIDSASNSILDTDAALKIYGGDGGEGNTGNGGNGGIGVEGKMGYNKGDIYGGDGGSTVKGDGGEGGTGLYGNIHENDGSILGGNGGDSIDGDGGDGGAGVIGDVDINKGEIYGGDGGDSENGHAGKGGDGVIGHVGENYGIIEAGEGGHDNQGGGEGGKDINTGDTTEIMLFAIPLLILLGGLITYLILRKRRNEE